MAITNGYCTLQEIKDALGIPDTVEDTTIEKAVNAASRQIDKFCGRRFYVDASVSARVLVADDPYCLRVPDFSTSTGLIVESGVQTGSFETTWSSSDYQLEPLNGLYRGVSWPFTTIRATRSLTFPMNYTDALVRVTAKWGWASVPDEVSQACVYQASMLWKFKDLPLGATSFNETGVLRLGKTLHPGAAALLKEYVRDGATV